MSRDKNPLLDQATGEESAELAAFAARLSFDAIPANVVDRCVDLFVDWAGSALSGARQRPVGLLEDYARLMGPSDGPAEILTSGRRTTPLFAAMVNAAASHVSEQDDVHNGAVFHPAAVVFPASLAVAQHVRASGQEFVTACVAGYEAGIRIGEFLGRSHYKVFHTTATAGTLAAAIAAGRLLGLDSARMLDAVGSAGTQAAGLWEFLRDAADSKQLHTAKAAGDGLTSAYLAKGGFTGARRILEGQKGMAAGMSLDADPSKLTNALGSRWALIETSFKFHASCRHTHPAADALLEVMKSNALKPGDISHVVAHVHQAAIDVLGSVSRPSSVHQAKFSMPATLGLIAVHARAGLAEFDHVLNDEAALGFLDKVEMRPDEEVEARYPAQWIGKVTVRTVDGRELFARVDEPKGDPGNTLSRQEIETKAAQLAKYGGSLAEGEWKKLSGRLWSIASAKAVTPLRALS